MIENSISLFPMNDSSYLHGTYWPNHWARHDNASGSMCIPGVVMTLHRWHPSCGKHGHWLFTISYAGLSPIGSGVYSGQNHNAVVDDFGNLVLVD